MNITTLKYFTEVVKTESMSAAAENLFISHQGLSSSIKRMERELGITLFQRDNQKSVLTKEGQYILKYITEIVDNYDNILDYVHSLSNAHPMAEHFNVRLVATPFTSLALFRLLSLPFLQENPPYANTCTECTNHDELLQVLSQSNINIGLLMVPRVAEKQFLSEFQNFKVYKLFDDVFMAFSNSSSSLKSDTISLAKLQEWPQFIFSSEYRLEDFKNIRFINNRPEYHISSIFERNVITLAPNLLGSELLLTDGIKKC